jgi:hypothetical protein
MQAVMFAYALFTGVFVLILLTVAIVVGISALMRKVRGSSRGAKPPGQS